MVFLFRVNTKSTNALFVSLPSNKMEAVTDSFMPGEF